MTERKFYPSWIVVLIAFLSSLRLQQKVKAFGPSTNQKKHASLSSNGTPNSGNKNKEKHNIDVENKANLVTLITVCVSDTNPCHKKGFLFV